MSEESYIFRVPGEATALRTLLARAWPNVTRRQITAALRARKIRVGRRTVQDAGKPLTPGVLVRVDGVPQGEAEAHEAAVEHSLSVDRPLVVLVPSPPWNRGVLKPNKGLEVAFEILESRGGVSALRLEIRVGDVDKVREHFSELGMAILGDALNEGVLVEGGLRIREEDAPQPAGFWPEEPVFTRSARSKKQKEGRYPAILGISSETLSAIKKGHPWILADKDTGDAKRYQPGTLVRLEGARQGPEVTARTTGSHPLVARVWNSTPGNPQFERSVEGRVNEAFALRSKLHDSPETNAYRLIHGEVDGLPGVAVDRLGSLLRVLYTSRCLEQVRDRLIGAIMAQGQILLGQIPAIIEVIHLRNRPQGELECVRVVEGPPPMEDGREGFMLVQERGLNYWIEPGLNEIYRPRPGFGLFLDQRQNRSNLSRNAQGERWLNLFCHTGAFSVSLLHAGASEVISVDLSRPYLRWLDENLELNGLKDQRHQGIKQDARRFLERLKVGDSFDGIILDPPTAAATGNRFWSVKKEVGQLIGLCLKHLRPGGRLLVTRNDRRARGKLGPLIQEVAKLERVHLQSLHDAPPGSDFPKMKGFPEGDSFQGVLAKRG